MQSFDSAYAFINAITSGNAETELIDWRAIHDANKAIPAIPFRDTLRNAWNSIVHYNSNGYGIFATIAAMDGNGRHLANVHSIRAHYVDLDNLSAEQNYQNATAWTPLPSFAVQSSPGKYHVYWTVQRYSGNDRFELTQRKLRQYFDGDGAIIDPTRVMRVPGTINTKYSNPQSEKYTGAQPHLVTCWALPGFGFQYDPAHIEQALAHVNVVNFNGTRHELGDPSLSAPSLDWIKFGLQQIDPNSLDRAEWISLTAAVKQSGWLHVQQEQELFDIWSAWCAQYEKNDLAENWKQWNSIRQTEIGWNSIVRRVPSLLAYEKLGDRSQPQSTPAPPSGPNQTVTAPSTPPPMPAPTLDCSGEILTDVEQREWFKGCFYVERLGEILTPSGRFMNATKFNGKFGGKNFIYNSQGKVTDEAWKAATRSTLWTVPKVDHTRFLPHKEPLHILTDTLGRKGVNIYKPAIIETRQGDPSPFLNHLAAILPVPEDQKILLDFFAHNARFPGFKIPWAPLVQSAEGVGKGVFKTVLSHVMGGSVYVHFPNAQEMVESGSKFNAWMRHKLFILCDEIKVDEKRDMVEVLKPMISEKEIEVQGKGADQILEDNYSNWTFFSNWKDAIPISRNGRRYCVFYSAIQTVDDLMKRGMNDEYFNRLISWLENGGAEIVAHYLLTYPIERGSIPMRAPETSSTAEALRKTQSPAELALGNAVADMLPGFRGGWISLTAALNRLKIAGVRSIAPATVTTILEAMGYAEIGRSPRTYIQEDASNRSTLFNASKFANVNDFGRMQGYE